MWSTQKNEALNTSVSSYAPKVKHYLATDSLLGRVSIAAGCQVVGYAAFWTKICSSLGFDIDPNLLSVLLARDEKKRKAQIRQATLDGKRKRSKSKHKKINKEHQQYMDGVKAGLEYESGVALKVAKKNLPASKDRNPKDTWGHLLSSH